MTIVAAGLASMKAAPCAAPTASASAASVMNIRVRTTSFSPPPSSARAPAMISMHLAVWAPGSGSQLPSGQIGAVPETITRSPTRSARAKPKRGSKGEPDPIRTRSVTSGRRQRVLALGKLLEADDHPVTECEQLVDSLLGGEAAGLAAGSLTGQAHHQLVTEIDDL